MIVFKRASVRDLQKITLAVMCLKGSPECITTDEMQDYIDRCYYCEDTDTHNIVAIIVAARITLDYPSLVEGEVITTYPNKYQIKYALFDTQAIKDAGEDVEKVLSCMIRELTADMNDWSVMVDPESLASFNFTSDKEESLKCLKKALENNSFKLAVNRTGMYRLMPIDFNRMY